MAAESNKKEDVFQWVWNIISSCDTIEQYKSTAKIIQLFQSQYNDRDLVITLKNRRMMVWDELYSQNKKGILKG